MNKQVLATAISAALCSVFVTNNSGMAYGFEGQRILSARERETDEPQELLLDEDKAFRLQDYLNEQDPNIAVVIQPFQGGTDGNDIESDGPSAEALAEKAAADQAEADRVAAEQKAADEKAAADKAEADRVAAEQKAAEDKAAADKAAAAAAKKTAVKA